MTRVLAFLSSVVQYISLMFLLVYGFDVVRNGSHASVWNAPGGVAARVHGLILVPLVVGMMMSLLPTRKCFRCYSCFQRWFLYGTMTSFVICYVALAICQVLPND